MPLRIYTRSGQLIAQIGEKRRVPVAYDDIPLLVREAFVAAEDQRFFSTMASTTAACCARRWWI